MASQERLQAGTRYYEVIDSVELIGPNVAVVWIKRKISGLKSSPRFPTLPANLEEHICCLYAFSPIPSTESSSDIPLLIASIAAPSPQTKSAYWGCPS